MVTHVWSVYVLAVPNGKKYIGVTGKEPKRRWNYGHGYEKNSLLFAAIKEYGWGNIKKEIVATFPTSDEAYALEQELIKKHKTTDPEYGYNRAAGGFGTTGFYPNEESRKKMSKSHVGKQNHCVPVCQFDRDKKLVAVYPSAKEASSVTGINYKSIMNCCYGVTKQAGGYTWQQKTKSKE